jgi:hypothetical protein
MSTIMRLARLKGTSCKHPSPARTACLAFLICWGCLEVRATDVSGTIVNQVWTTNGSPYRVVGDIQVAKLTISPGVTVLFTSNYVFEVAGRLKALGSPALPILFTATNTGSKGLFFNQSLAGCELAHCIIEKATTSGIRIVKCMPLISDCIIRSNTVSVQYSSGGNLLAEAYGGGIATDTSLTLDNCIIHHNEVKITVSADNPTAIGRGAGVYSTAPLQLLNCTVSSNYVSAVTTGRFFTSSGVSRAQGAGIWATNLTLQNCLIRGNSGSADSSVNNAAGASAECVGSGVWCSGESILRNSIVQANTAKANASPWSNQLEVGGVFLQDSQASVVNCTIAFNQGHGVVSGASGTKVINSIVWGHPGSQILMSTNVTYSDIQGGYPGIGNINANPIFLSLQELIIVDGSPCMNAGDTNAVSRDIYFPPSLPSSRNDMGAHGGPGAGARLRLRVNEQCEVIVLGAVPGPTYSIEGSTNLMAWGTVQQFQIVRLGDAAYFVEPGELVPQKFFKLNLAP